MSLVGPRPDLFNQVELIRARNHFEVFSVRPGFSGLSHFSKVDMFARLLLVKADAQVIKNLTLSIYFKYIFLAVIDKGSGDRIG